MKYDDTDLPPLELKGPVSITAPVAYSFRFNGYASWAIFTINDYTGEFTINSDWGDWSYRWHTDSLGKGVLLTQFLLQCDADYIVHKFAKGRVSDLQDEVDPEETLKCIRKKICEERGDQAIAARTARFLWLEAQSFVDDGCDLDNMDSDLYRFLDEPWDYIAHRKSHRYMFLVKRLIPFFQQWLKRHLTNGDSPLPGQPIK